MQMLKSILLFFRTFAQNLSEYGYNQEAFCKETDGHQGHQAPA
jgi:hypothetical protein